MEHSNPLPVLFFPLVTGFVAITQTLGYFLSKERELQWESATNLWLYDFSNISTLLRLTGNIFEHAEHFALWRHSLDARMVLQSQQVARRSSADVDQLKVTGEVRCWILSGNDVPFQHVISNVSQGTADVQAACFGWEVSNKSNDVFCTNRPGVILKNRY